MNPVTKKLVSDLEIVVWKSLPSYRPAGVMDASADFSHNRDQTLISEIGFSLGAVEIPRPFPPRPYG